MPRDVCIIHHCIQQTDPDQSMEQAVYNFVEDEVDGDVVGLEAWSNGDVCVWVRK